MSVHKKEITTLEGYKIEFQKEGGRVLMQISPRIPSGLEQRVFTFRLTEYNMENLGEEVYRALGQSEPKAPAPAYEIHQSIKVLDKEALTEALNEFFGTDEESDAHNKELVKDAVREVLKEVIDGEGEQDIQDALLIVEDRLRNGSATAADIKSLIERGHL